MKKEIVTLIGIVFIITAVHAQDQTIDGHLTINNSEPNTLRLENDVAGQETTIRFRSKPSNGLGWLHSDIGVYATGSNTGFLGFKVPHNNSFGSGYKMVINSSGNVGIGTTSPDVKFHIEDNFISESSIGKIDANLIVQATSTTRNANEGAAIGFIVPANTDGSNHWQQGRILVTPDNNNNGRADGRMYLQTRYYGNNAWRWRKNLVLKSTGSVGVGTDETGSHKLAVDGSIGARSIKVEASGWSDFVFFDNYNLRSLEETEQYIQENQHLPDIPSEQEVNENGIDLCEMDAKLLQKIEELTLYMIDLNKQVQQLKAENQILKNKIEE